MPSLAILLALALSVALVFPVIGVVLCGLILTLQISIIVIRMAVGRWYAARDVRAVAGATPIFSVHVATHNEPAKMVGNTLRALAQQSWPQTHYEVIVIDNNTANPALWTPVRDECDRLGQHFKFLHRMDVSGAKAGALNIGLASTRTDATHIVTVDADYQVDAKFLMHAAAALQLTGAAYVQFPQDRKSVV